MSQMMSEDLGYLRDLAEAGQSAPLLSGRFLAWWGGLGTLAYLVHFAMIERMFGLGPQMLTPLWSGFAAIGLGGFFLLLWRFPPSKPGAASLGNRVTATVWKGCGIILFAFFAGVTVRSLLDGQASDGFLWSVPLVLAMYGIGQLTSGRMSGNPTVEVAGWGAIGGVAIAALFTGSSLIWLVGAGVAGLTVFLPGVLLMRAEPGEVV